MFVTSITSGVGTAIQCAGDVVTALISTDGALQPLLEVVGLAVGIGLVGWGIRTIKSLTWGF